MPQEIDFKDLHNVKKTKRDRDPTRTSRRRQPRFVSSSQGPAHAEAAARPRKGDVSYCGSAKTFDEACRMKADLDAPGQEGMVVLIYRFVRIPSQFLLVRTDVINSGEQPRGEVVAFRLFRVSQDLAEPKQRGALADKIEELLKAFGQTGDATGVGPR